MPPMLFGELVGMTVFFIIRLAFIPLDKARGMKASQLN